MTAVQQTDLPIDPLRDWLKHRLIMEGIWDPERDEVRGYSEWNPPRRSLSDLAQCWGVSVRTLGSILRHRSFVSDITADRIFVAAGEPYLLRELYAAELYA